MRFSRKELGRIGIAGTLTILGAMSLRTSWDNTGQAIDVAKECKPSAEQTCNDEYVNVTRGVIEVLAYAAVTGIGVGLSYVGTIGRGNKKLK